MLKRVIIAGLLGGLVLILWTFIVNGIFGFTSSIDMKKIENERLVYQTLKENITKPGRYICNPEIATDEGFPSEDAVFSIHYSVIGHGSAGMLAFVGLIIFFIVPTIAAWMLSMTSEKIQSSYSRKVLFFTAIGLLFAFFGDIKDFGIHGYPLNDAIILAMHSILVWTVIGLVVAWRIKPQPEVPKSRNESV